jgi:hypothetical protein
VSVPFAAASGLVVIRAELVGPAGSANLRLAVDTGATSTLIGAGMLVAIGYDPALAPDRVQITTGSGIEFAPGSRWTRSRPWVRSGPAFPCFATHCRHPPASTACSGWISSAVNA